MEDLKLVKKLIDRDNAAWSIFVRRFDQVIRRRINQVFYRYALRSSTADFQDAYDFVFDHFMFAKTLNSYKKDQSLEGFVVRVTTHATIDWYRKRNSEKNSYGLDASEVVHLVESGCAVSATENTHDKPNSDPDNSEIFLDIEWSHEEDLVLRVMLVRTVPLSNHTIESIAKISQHQPSEIQSQIDNLCNQLHERWSEKHEIYDEIGILWMRYLILLRRGDSARAADRKTLLDKRLADYQSKGVEPYPTRKELAAVFNWDINKIDRIKRRIEEKLKNSLARKSSGKTPKARTA